MEVLIINGHDYSQFIERKGFGWSRNDIDGENTTRTKAGTMRRQKLTTKRKLSYTMINMTQEQLAQLDDDLNEDTFSATYLDLHGEMTRSFYCSSFSATIVDIINGYTSWEGASFSIVEV